jgi:hypothetical protein
MLKQERLNDLKKEFTLIIILKNEITETFDNIKLRVIKVKDVYEGFIKNSKNFIFGLDSFKFQGKLLDIEYDDMMRLFKLVSNKIYCDYYKLFKMVSDYVDVNIKEKKIRCLIKLNEYSVYKDLEPYKEYDFSELHSIHESTITILLGIFDLALNEMEEVRVIKNKRDMGFNIDNYINSYQYNIDIILQKIRLFVDYMGFFHINHLKYLKRILNKLQSFSEQLNKEVRFEEKNEEQSESLKLLISDDVDIKTLTEMKNMICGSCDVVMEEIVQSFSCQNLAFYSDNVSVNSNVSMEMFVFDNMEKRVTNSHSNKFAISETISDTISDNSDKFSPTNSIIYDINMNSSDDIETTIHSSIQETEYPVVIPDDTTRDDTTTDLINVLISELVNEIIDRPFTDTEENIVANIEQIRIGIMSQDIQNI